MPNSILSSPIFDFHPLGDREPASVDTQDRYQDVVLDNNVDRILDWVETNVELPFLDGNT